MSYDLKNFKVLGYTTDFQKCDCCGRENLKGTVSILDLVYDTVMHYGTGCAASTDKYDTLEANKKAKREVNSAVKAYKESEGRARIYARSAGLNRDTDAKTFDACVAEIMNNWYDENGKGTFKSCFPIVEKYKALVANAA